MALLLLLSPSHLFLSLLSRQGHPILGSGQVVMAIIAFLGAWRGGAVLFYSVGDMIFGRAMIHGCTVELLKAFTRWVSLQSLCYLFVFF